MNYQGLMPQGCLAGISGIYDGRDEHISHQTGAGGAYQTAAVPGTGAQHNLAGGAYKTAAIPQTGGQHSLPGGGASETGPSEPESSKSGLHALVRFQMYNTMSVTLSNSTATREAFSLQ